MAGQGKDIELPNESGTTDLTTKRIPDRGLKGTLRTFGEHASETRGGWRTERGPVRRIAPAVRRDLGKR